MGRQARHRSGVGIRRPHSCAGFGEQTSRQRGQNRLQVHATVQEGRGTSQKGRGARAQEDPHQAVGLVRWGQAQGGRFQTRRRRGAAVPGGQTEGGRGRSAVRFSRWRPQRAGRFVQAPLVHAQPRQFARRFSSLHQRASAGRHRHRHRGGVLVPRRLHRCERHQGVSAAQGIGRPSAHPCPRLHVDGRRVDAGGRGLRHTVAQRRPAVAGRQHDGAA